MVAAGLESLKWLMNVQTGASGQFRPIGCHGFMQKGEAPALYDQQPIEAWASVSACISAFEVTANPAWIEKAKGAFSWFLGQNDLGQALYDSSTGGCRDGLMVDQLNENQGAESTISFMSALAELTAAISVKAVVGQAQVQA
jgi:hypothetical protein